MPAGKYIALQPALTLVLAQYFQYPAFSFKKLVVIESISYPLPFGYFKYFIQPVGQCFIGAEYPEVMLV